MKLIKEGGTNIPIGIAVIAVMATVDGLVVKNKQQ